jgi:hypothetical protein
MSGRPCLQSLKPITRQAGCSLQVLATTHPDSYRDPTAVGFPLPSLPRGCSYYMERLKKNKQLGLGCGSGDPQKRNF